MTTENNGIEKLIRPDLAGFAGYAASKSPDVLEKETVAAAGRIVKLDANENPYGCSPRVNSALASFSDFSIYPDAEQTELRELLSEYTGVSASNIVASAGSDQLIDLLMRLFVSPGDEVISCTPTFAMFRFFTDLVGGKAVEIARKDDFSVDVEAVLKAITLKTKLILLATPNNPTGTLTPKEDIIKLLDSGLPLLVDEAYYEFTGQTMAPLVGKRPNLMVLRTFSKWAGLAGLRIGYGLFPKRIAEYLMAIKEPYCVNAAAQLAVSETMRDIEYLQVNIRKIVDERKRLFKILEEISWLEPYPTQANFILCSVNNGKAKDLQKLLEDRGILVRYFDKPFLNDCIRISVGKPEDSDILVTALREIGGE
jgi:histidinol-phosphate aminotransferase